MNAALRTPDSHLYVHDLWWTTDNSSSLTGESIARLGPYITRFAQTLGVAVLAVGGAADHLHLLFDLDSNRSADEITAELQKTTTRYLRDTLAVRGFAWSEASALFSVSPHETPVLREYIEENYERHAENRLLPYYEGIADNDEESDDDTPDWLRDVMESRE